MKIDAGAFVSLKVQAREGASPHFSLCSAKQPRLLFIPLSALVLFTAMFASDKLTNHLISIRADPFTLLGSQLRQPFHYKSPT